MPGALLLFLIIFVWTPPHFWALAIHRREDYAKAGIPMLPVTHGVAYTAVQIILYTLLLVAVSMLPYAHRHEWFVVSNRSVDIGGDFFGVCICLALQQ